MMLRVLFITRKWPPAVGGMEVYSVELASHLEKICDLSVLKLPGRADGSPPSMFSLIRFMLLAMVIVVVGRRVDVIHLGDIVLWPLGIVGRVFQPKAGLIISSHGTDVGYARCSGILAFIYRIYLKCAVHISPRKIRVIANSQYTADCCRQVGFLDVVVVPLGSSEPSTYEQEPPEVEPYVLFVGRLIKRKGAKWFVQNVLSLIDPRIILVVVGPRWDESEWEAISNNPKVMYRGVVSSREELKRLRRNALATVVPNIPTGGHDFEGFGLSAPEVAADGGVLLASRIEGIVDAVIDGETGFLLPPEDAASWVEKIREIYNWSPEYRRKFILGARQTVMTRFSWNRVAEDTYRQYESVAGRGARV